MDTLAMNARISNAMYDTLVIRFGVHFCGMMMHPGAGQLCPTWAATVPWAIQA